MTGDCGINRVQAASHQRNQYQTQNLMKRINSVMCDVLNRVREQEMKASGADEMAGWGCESQGGGRGGLVGNSGQTSAQKQLQEVKGE
jgi:hypothetical protein